MDILENMFRSFIVTALLVLMPAYASAQVPIEKELKVYRVHEVAGQQGTKERLVEVDSPISGGIFEYELTYQNVSGKNLDGIVIRQPIGANATYIYGSASAPEDVDIYVSADNGVSFQPESGTSQNQDNESGAPKISGNVFRALQWVFRRPLAADENLTLRYRVIAE
ncbi:MAG: hypothetical protein ACFHHU_07910 [Porticoccaceae bacterium]